MRFCEEFKSSYVRCFSKARSTGLSQRLINSKEPFQVVYAIYRHEYLGCLISSHVVQKLPNGRLSLQYQGLNPTNFDQFEHVMDESDREIVRLTAELNHEVISKKYGGKTRHATEFFLKKYNGQVKTLVNEYINRRMAEIMPLLPGKYIGVMGSDGYPAYRTVKMLEDKASILFHFRRNETEVRYYPTIKLRGKKIDFQFRNTELVCLEPAWLLLDQELFTFDRQVDGRKLKPFLKKWYIAIPEKSEREYYRKFVTNLVERYRVRSETFKSMEIQEEPDFALEIAESNGVLALKPKVYYGPFQFSLQQISPVKVVMEEEHDEIVFYKVLRNQELEKAKLRFLEELRGQQTILNWEFMDRQEALGWLAANKEGLEEAGFAIEQQASDNEYNFEQPEIVMETSENGDWFDIKAVVKIGTFSIPFVQFRKHILKGQRDFQLPDGSFAILPESWFTDYRHLLEIADSDEGEQLRIKRYQAGLLDMLSGNQKDYLEKVGDLIDSESTSSELPVPASLNAELRTYQQRGFEWMNALRTHKLGGILADDMGLGKTLQTLTFMLNEVEQGVTVPSLVIMPTSLVYNWLAEAKKFTPSLKIHIHTGLNRTKDPAVFSGNHLVLSTYGTVRQDVDMLEQFPFHYLILDESQMIKNPASKTAKAVKRLHSNFRLSLTGTPLENTLLDLWSQMSFLNPGLLGGEMFFKKFYVDPIEKLQDEKRKEKLKKLIHPFILRRTKSEVAKELPPKVEKIHYCEMDPTQKEMYEETKNSYRNFLLNLTTATDFNKQKLNILTGLQRLRQISIHPQMVKEEECTSGKYEEFKRMLDLVLEKGSKVLVFSQFVKFLQIIKKDLDERRVRYSYLDGSVKNRKEQVDRFQQIEDVQVFLISLKAGGVGLNLTAAEYVFLMDPWWNPAVENQAIDRSHRIGQTKTVFYYKFISSGTIEEKILKLQERKAKLSRDIVSSEPDAFKSLGKEDLEELLT